MKQPTDGLVQYTTEDLRNLSREEIAALPDPDPRTYILRACQQLFHLEHYQMRVPLNDHDRPLLVGEAPEGSRSLELRAWDFSAERASNLDWIIKCDGKPIAIVPSHYLRGRLSSG